MPAKTKNPKKQAYKLIGLCAAALVLGSVIPLFFIISKDSVSNSYLVIVEAGGSAALLYVFGLYLLKK